jgi:hypothetical protein
VSPVVRGQGPLPVVFNARFQRRRCCLFSRLAFAVVILVMLSAAHFEACRTALGQSPPAEAIKDATKQLKANPARQFPAKAPVPVSGSIAQGPVANSATATAATEYNLKLSRLYATAKFITWPDESRAPAAPFVIGIVEPDPFQGGLHKLAGRKLKDHPIRVVFIKSVQDYVPCHVLFIPTEANPSVVNDLIKHTWEKPVLVWRDQPDPAGSAGVAFTFARQDDTLMIEADPAELKRRNLTPDGRLMSLNLIRILKPAK